MPENCGFAATPRLAWHADPRRRHEVCNISGVMNTHSMIRSQRSPRRKALGRFTLLAFVAILSLAAFGGPAHAEHAADTIDEKRRAIAAEIHELSDAAGKVDQKSESDDRLAQLRALDVLYVQIQARAKSGSISRNKRRCWRRRRVAGKVPAR